MLTFRSIDFRAGLERRGTWKRFILNKSSGGSGGTPQHTSGTSTDTELTTLDTHELWLPESEPPPSAMSALHAFGAEMLKLSRGLEGMAGSPGSQTPSRSAVHHQQPPPQQQQLLLQHGSTPRRCSFRNGYASLQIVARFAATRVRVSRGCFASSRGHLPARLFVFVRSDSRSYRVTRARAREKRNARDSIAEKK